MATTKHTELENQTTKSKFGLINRTKSNSSLHISEIKNKFLSPTGPSNNNSNNSSYSEGQPSNNVGTAINPTSNQYLSPNSKTKPSSSSLSQPQPISSHHKTNSSSSLIVGGSNFQDIKASFSNLSSSYSHNSGLSGLISPRMHKFEQQQNNSPSSSSSTTPTPLSPNGNLKGRNVASIIAANGANLNKSLSNLQLQANGGLNSSTGSNSSINSSSSSLSNNNISISSSSNSIYGHQHQNSNGGQMSYMDLDNGSNGTIGEVANHLSYEHQTTSTTSKSISETIEIMVIGDELSNKARFISSFLNNGIGDDPTLDVSTKKSLAIQSGAYTVNINTTVGQEEFWGINDIFYRSSQGFIFVYNVNNRESFLSFLKFRDKIIHEKSTENILMTMVGLTSPLINSETGEESSIREVTTTEAKRMADLYSCSFVELSSFGLDCEHQIQSIVTDLLGRITNYQSNVNNSSDSSQQTLELLMLGDIFVGKTQIIQRLLGNNFSFAYKETTEWNKNVIQMTVNDVRYMIKMVDTCGLDIEETLNRERLVSSQGFVFVYSISSRESFLMIETLRKKLLAVKGDSKIPAVLIANKGDSLIRQVTFDEGSKMAQHLGGQFFEVSSFMSDDESILYPIQQLVMDVQKSSNNTVEMGEIKKKGYLFKEGKKLKSMSKYYFKVSKCTLSYCKNESNKSKFKNVQLSEQIQLAIPHSEKKDIWPFQVILDPVSKQSINLIATSEEERNSWIKAIKFNCYLEEIACNIIEDVVKNIVSEVAQQHLPNGQSLKRSDTIQQFQNSPSKPNINVNGLSQSTNSSPYHSHHYNHLSQSTSSMSPEKLQSVHLSSSNLSSSMSSYSSLSSSFSSSYSDSISSSPPSNGSEHQYPQSPQLKKSLFQRTTSFSKSKGGK
ncbi:hypothetical protein DICPUDRAFT_96273 [Dictyostelium purpureum]|uniref:PH domain-containing protein n=1 Tax=Dictyostelium purpureum TaxID=5786 RepID=F0Z6P7_DICPU|nr:uncharacterized protein DICPUDRAFT_96273 [Dictyostelium purpureum]EGC40346.1 hypothetical protein DICPUDRAFT_96273 [Dictyostelium purpureum]|eukprot:XP_003283097.1 hypothetical protein DICPUDRAFT_96273 [Dictyostelium purpureum]